MAETKKRIIQFNATETFSNDDYLLIDGQTNGTRKILASNVGGSGGGGGGLSYSTTEQDTGLKWIDGKPIYQRTFEYSEGIDVDGDGVPLPTDITNALINVDNFIKAEAVRTTSGFTHACIAVWVNSNRKIYSADPWGRVNIFTFWYTKTTDTV